MHEQLDSSDPTLVGIEAMFLAAGNTDDVISWEALRQRLKTSPPGLTDSERCALLLRIANRERLTGSQWNQLVGANVASGADGKRFAATEKMLRGVIATLRSIVELKKAAVDDLAETAAQVVTQCIVISPTWQSGKRVDRIIAHNTSGAVGYGLWLFLDPTKPFRDLLCRCELSTCHRFFLERRPESGKGRSMRHHCTAEHRIDADREKAARRMRKNRSSNR